MPRYHIWTIGCQMNKADSRRLADELERRGYTPTECAEDADLVVLNSCVVRQSAENRVVGRLTSLRPLKRLRPEARIALTGCMVGLEPDGLARRFPYVDAFCRPGDFQPLLALVRGADATQPAAPYAVTAYVPIIEGCDNYCSYCIVPYRRGRERSRPLAEIVCEIEALAARGVREVTLLGQNVDSYGHDLPDRLDLASLLEAVNALRGLTRVRFLTSHPKDMTPRLIDAVARLDKVCEHFCLPLQAGDDATLLAMRRGYTVDDYRRLVALIRECVPGAALSTDVIVGFPGEAEAQFQRTLRLLAELRFGTVHVAAYSPRPGTAAARLCDDVPPDAKKERLRLVEEQQERIAAEINAGLVGTEVEVLVEERVKGKWSGRTRGDKIVFFGDAADQRRRLVLVRIERATAWSLQGRLSAAGAGDNP